MHEKSLTIPELILIAGTRVALGAGLGLLIGSRLSSDARNAAGWALTGVGALATIPIAIGILGKPQSLARKAA